MPFDGKKFREPLKTGLAGLAQLRDELRKPMPAIHEWNFGEILEVDACGTQGCAIGLACITWPNETRRWLDNCSWVNEDVVGRALGLDKAALEEIFLSGSWYPTDVDVTPAMVADKIDEHLIANGFSG